MKFKIEQGLTTDELNHAWHQIALQARQWPKIKQLAGLQDISDHLMDMEAGSTQSPYTQISEVLGILLVVDMLNFIDPLVAHKAYQSAQDILINQAKKVAHDIQKIRQENNILYTARFTSSKRSMTVSDVLFNVIQGNLIIQNVSQTNASRYLISHRIYKNPDMEQAIIYPHRLGAAIKGILQENTFMPNRIKFLLDVFDKASNYHINDLDTRRLLTLLNQALVANFKYNDSYDDPLMEKTAKVFIDFSIDRLKDLPRCTPLLQPHLWPPQVADHLAQRLKNVCSGHISSSKKEYYPQNVHN